VIKICLNKTRSEIHMDLSDNFTVQNGLKQGDVLSPLLFNVALGLDYDVSEVQGNARWAEIIWNTSASGLC
jgi:hypothetical protein